MKRILVGLIAVVMMFSLCACGPNQTQKDAFDDDSIIKSNSDSSYMKNSVSTNVGDSHTFTFSQFYGVKTIKTFSLSGSVAITYALNLNGGRFKLVLVGDDEVIVIAQETHSDTVTVERSGTYRLKMVGDDANATVVISY